VSEVPSLVTRASDWEDAVRAVAVSNGLNPNTFLETAWKAIATCDFDYQGAHTSSGSLAAILTKTRAKQIQSPDTPTGLNDVNLWPDTTSVSSGFWLPTMPTDYDSLDEGENEMPRGRLF